MLRKCIDSGVLNLSLPHRGKGVLCGNCGREVALTSDNRIVEHSYDGVVARWPTKYQTTTEREYRD